MGGWGPKGQNLDYVIFEWSHSFRTLFLRCVFFHIIGHKECEICGKIYSGQHAKRDLVNHVKTHQKKQTLCQFCNNDYKTPWRLKRHQNICFKKKQALISFKAKMQDRFNEIRREKEVKLSNLENDVNLKNDIKVKNDIKRENTYLH